MEANNNKKVLSTVGKLALLFLLGCVSSYGLPFAITRTVYYSIVLILFLRSKDHVFWTAFLFILVANPLGLLEYRWFGWILQLTPTVGITYKAAFGFAFLLKRKDLIQNAQYLQYDVFSKYYKVFGLYVVFLMFVGFVYGFSFVQLFSLLDYLPSLLIIVVLPRMFSQKQMLEFNKLIFLFSILMTAATLVGIISNGALIRMLTFGQSSAGVIYKDGLIRITGGIFISLYTMFAGMFYLVKSGNEFKTSYLWIVVLLAWLFILSSATRGWMIASTVFLFLSLMYYSVRLSGTGRIFLGFLVLAFIGYLLLPAAVKENLSLAFDRLETVEAMTEGDLTAEGTASRFTERGPRVLSRFDESPVFGFGYSKITYRYYENHVGNHDLLLVGGVLGLLIVWLSVFSIIAFIFRLEKNGYGKSIFVFGIAIITMMLIHTTSRNMVSFLMPVDSAFLLALILSNVNSFSIKTNIKRQEQREWEKREL